MVRLPILTGLLLCICAAGCSSTQKWSGLTSHFSRKSAEEDALVLDDELLSEGFQKSRGGLTAKGLKNPEGTNLAFARWKEDMDQFAEAKRRYHEVLTANPDCLPARLGIARIERETGRFTQCLEILEAARRQHPSEPAVVLEMGRMYNDRQQWNDAVRAFSQAADLAPDDQTIRYELGLALTNAGRLEEGLAHLKFAVGESAACYNVAYLMNEQGRTADAVNWIERALNSHPDERTRQMAGEMLAKMRQQNPALHHPARSAIASRQQEDMTPPQIIAASPPRTRTAEVESAAPASPAVWTSRSTPPAAASAPSGFAGAPGISAVADASRQTAPPQWSGPGYAAQPQQQPPQQSQWSRSSRSKTPVHAAGYSQQVTSPAEPPVWRQ